MMKYQKLKKYLITTFAISWITWIILALLVKNNILQYSSLMGSVIFYFGGLAPAISAIFVQENKSLKSIMKFIFSSKKKSVVYLLLFCLLEILTLGLSSMQLNSAVPLNMLPVLFLMCISIGGGSEELGWRGTMQPILEKNIAFPIATLITGIIWSLWHLPLWFIDGTSQQNIPFFLFAIYAIFLSYWLAAIYKKTNCVFYCSILHGLSNLLMSIFIIKVNLILVCGLIVMNVLSLVLYYKNDNGLVK